MSAYTSAARALQALGHDVRLATYHLGRDMPGIPVSRIPGIPWYGKLAAGPSWHKPYLDLLLFFTALRLARSFRPDLIHAHLHEGAFVGQWLRRFLRIPLLFDCQGSLTGEMAEHRFVYPGTRLHRFFQKMERAIVHSADQVVTSSSLTAAMLVRDFQLPPARVTPLIDAVNTEDFSPGPRDPDLFRELRLPAGKKIIVYLGVMSEQQGVDLLLDVADRVCKTRNDIHFLLMGYPDGAYREKAAARGLTAQITFTGRIPYAQAASYLRLGDVAVSPKLSNTEANGKLFNYMACGLPCVVSDTPVNREILAETGIYAARGDVGDTAAKLIRLLDDEAERKTLAQAVRDMAVQKHSWSARGTQLSEICARLLQVRP